MTDPIALALRVASILDSHDVPYALGGSLASTIFGEPRGTVDIDIAVRLEERHLAELLAVLEMEFYVPVEAARQAVELRTSFNLVDGSGLKVDLFVLGDDLLDRLQLERRRRIAVRQEPPEHLWVTSPGDQILRKLAWYRAGGHVSERQWRDVVGLLRTQQQALDIEDLTQTASLTGLGEMFAEALSEAQEGR